MPALKSQSAMEYLMTYGWMILVIAIITIAFFQTGILGSGNFMGPTACIAQPGFICSNLIFSANIVNLYSEPSLSGTIGNTAGPWSNMYFIIVPQGQVITDTSLADEMNPNDFFYWGQLYGQYYFIASAASNQETNMKIYVSASFPGASFPAQIGSKLNGAIWVMYTTPSTTNALSEVAIFRAVAVIS